MRRIVCVLLAGVLATACTTAGRDPAVPATDAEATQGVADARQRVAMPQLRDMEEDEAVDFLLVFGLIPGETILRYDDEVAAGAVIRTQPVAGESVPKGTVVDLSVSLGPEPGVPGGPQAPVATRAPRPRSTAAPTTERPLPPSSGSSAEPTPAVTPDPTPIAVRDFGFGDAFERTEGSVRLTGRGTRHRTTDHIAWRIALPDLDPSTEYRIRITRNSDDTVVARIEGLTEGKRVVYGRFQPLERPGTYTVRLYLDGELVARERLTIVAAR